MFHEIRWKSLFYHLKLDKYAYDYDFMCVLNADTISFWKKSYSVKNKHFLFCLIGEEW